MWSGHLVRKGRPIVNSEVSGYPVNSSLMIPLFDNDDIRHKDAEIDDPWNRNFGAAVEEEKDSEQQLATVFKIASEGHYSYYPILSMN
jgi:hypothetical protein